LIFEIRNKLNDYIHHNNDKKSTVLLAVDNHDTAHPLIWQRTPAERKGVDGMKLRFFISRFMNVGENRRPKYECIGNQDMSSGLYKANNVEKSIKWVNNKEFNEIYHNIEDIYNEYKEMIIKSYINTYVITDNYAYWFIDNHKNTERLLCVTYLEKEGYKNENNEIIEPELHPVEGPIINIFHNFDGIEDYKILNISLLDKEKTDCKNELDEFNNMKFEKINPGDIFLYHIY
ncbi:MAG: hypothetical protein ACOCUI_03465, partial [bacterium]